ncbi:MAG: BamA/TamA family outer membrane protein, partial [Deltaproteobacteria bacterium]|nr:BamA/TamA family outer membrane protein [Deltaproteobacteria bacterium]
FGATKGSENFIDVDLAGLGGTNAFTRFVLGSGWYIPAPFKTTLHLQGKLGYVRQNSWGELPSYEKFYLGGINSMRGFKFGSVSPIDPETGDRIGGEKMMHFNFEIIFPLIPSAGVKGVVFFDAGNVWTKDQGYDITNLRQSVGGGIRWYSPVGPIRLEYGYIVRGEEGDGDGGWEFTIGSVF